MASPLDVTCEPLVRAAWGRLTPQRQRALLHHRVALCRWIAAVIRDRPQDIGAVAAMVTANALAMKLFGR
jgi:hypothetical protein